MMKKIAIAVLAIGCTAPEPRLSTATAASSGSTVGDYVDDDGCTTTVVLGLSQQIAEQAGCASPDSFVSFAGAPGITLTDAAVLPFLMKGARDDLEAVAATAPLDVNSALRTIAQQYLLYQWYLQGNCGITDAATPGTSNHEGGRAVDLDNWADRIDEMAAYGWAHDVPGDDVHFDHTSSPDDRGQDVLAFQVLWNANNPDDTIAEDGEYGPETEGALVQSPADGFAVGPSCLDTVTDPLVAGVVSIVVAATATPATRVHVTLTVANQGASDWPSATALELAGAAPSPLYDASWISPTVIATVGATAPNAMATIDFDVMTPAVSTETPISQALQLDAAGSAFGSITLAIDVVPDPAPPSPGTGGGCAVDGDAAWLVAVLPALLRRRRYRLGG